MPAPNRVRQLGGGNVPPNATLVEMLFRCAMPGRLRGCLDAKPLFSCLGSDAGLRNIGAVRGGGVTEPCQNNTTISVIENKHSNEGDVASYRSPW